ncbi:imm11 family protein [Paenibacillus sp. NPDC058071]|uniref:imm11 family protein n=1 Tax=Paenibacillus sp. NPDC058071 TaxID=3346326 RepID=UPI0036D994A7
MGNQKLTVFNPNCMYEFFISSDYPDKYWIHYDSNLLLKHINFIIGKKIATSNETLPEFSLKGKVSEEKLLNYDLLHCGNGPSLISPKFTEIILTYFNNEVQLIEAKLRVNDKEYSGYHIMNIIEKVSCMDKERSVFKLSHRPDGPITINNLVISKRQLNALNIFRLEESLSTIVVSPRFAELCSAANLEGLSFVEIEVN